VVPSVTGACHCSGAEGPSTTSPHWVVRRTGSTAIAADRAHYLTDIAVNLAVLTALGVTKLTGWHRADPAFGLGISGYMLTNALGIARAALIQLLDREISSEDRQRIREAVLACEGTRDIHDLRTRYAGDRTFVEYHLEVDGNVQTMKRSFPRGANHRRLHSGPILWALNGSFWVGCADPARWTEWDRTRLTGTNTGPSIAISSFASAQR
jgi:hypothetical protein